MHVSFCRRGIREDHSRGPVCGGDQSGRFVEIMDLQTTSQVWSKYLESYVESRAPETEMIQNQGEKTNLHDFNGHVVWQIFLDYLFDIGNLAFCTSNIK
jgi:hypothetical protein